MYCDRRVTQHRHKTRADEEEAEGGQRQSDLQLEALLLLFAVVSDNAEPNEVRLHLLAPQNAVTPHVRAQHAHRIENIEQVDELTDYLERQVAECGELK